MNLERTGVSSESSRGIHRISTLMRCAAAYGYGYILCLEPTVPRDPLALGTCCHLALEAHYNGRPWLDAIMRAPARVSFMSGKAAAVIPRYLAKWPMENPKDILGVEVEYAMTIGDQTFTRRFDRLIAEKRRGRCVLVAYDIKTAGRIPERLRKTSLDPTLFTQEMIGRTVIAPALGLEWGGLVLDLIPTDGKSDFVRQPLHWSQEMLNRAERSLLYWMREEEALLAQHARREIDPWELEQSFQCYPQGFKCDFGPLCTTGKIERGRFVKKTGN